MVPAVDHKNVNKSISQCQLKCLDLKKVEFIDLIIKEPCSRCE